MDVHGDDDTDHGPRGSPLLAAYEVCHDLCCSMVLQILHAQAQKLATRVGGLWATQLSVVFHKEHQVSEAPLKLIGIAVDGGVCEQAKVFMY